MILDDIILCLVFLVMGIAIGLNLPARQQPEPEEKLPQDLEKLQEELAVYKNLKDSLLADVRYWRDKAKQK